MSAAVYIRNGDLRFLQYQPSSHRGRTSSPEDMAREARLEERSRPIIHRLARRISSLIYEELHRISGLNYEENFTASLVSSTKSFITSLVSTTKRTSPHLWSQFGDPPGASLS